MISAYDYYTNVVKPTVEEFLDKRADVRRAFLACMATLHTVDYVMQNREPDPKAADKLVDEFKRDSLQQSSAFEVVAAFALASKHCRLTRGERPTFILETYVVKPGAVLERKSMGSFSME